MFNVFFHTFMQDLLKLGSVLACSLVKLHLVLYFIFHVYSGVSWGCGDGGQGLGGTPLRQSGHSC
jgi:hypothetical protein